MTFPDQSHINRIRDALWNRPESGASVMVGSGFSRNAQEAGPGAPKFPVWRDTVAMMYKELYPDKKGDNLKRALNRVSGNSNYLRLAQEYEAVFGREALHTFIKKSVPDNEYVPGDLHERLLKLPWRDIFTTNWDTLLERTRVDVVERAYGVVHIMDEIPSVPKPRIIKLHGSFPAYIPFIYTEEDFRTYPACFAPFVNTVQQAMMESVFCLIGFSGDDPNFLQWSGWVRDNLGSSTPKIYLAGWLDLSTHQRRMLEDRHVVPIDLAKHPNVNSWPDHLRHRLATDWILHTLKRGRPYDVTDWPKPRDWKREKIPDKLRPVEVVSFKEPLKDPKPPGPGDKLANSPEHVKALAHSWRHNREVYPGWLIIPPSKYHLIEYYMTGWEAVIIKSLPELLTVERLMVLRELVWRKEKLLEPLTNDIEQAIQAVLQEIDYQTKTIAGTEELSRNWIEIRESWLHLAMAMLTVARQDFDRDTFTYRLECLKPFNDDNPDVAHFIHHEKCLWALFELDYAALEELLNEWRTENCDPIWMTRKAAILNEVDRENEAIRLINQSIAITRKNTRENSSLAGQSREGWTLLQAAAIERGFRQLPVEKVEIPSPFKRLKELSALQCDAFGQKQDLLDDLQGRVDKKQKTLFDLGARPGKTVDLSNTQYRNWINAHRAIRLCEVAGLPPSAAHVAIGSDLLKHAAETLTIYNYQFAARLALRIANSEDDAVFTHVWSRARMAMLSDDAVSTLTSLVKRAIDHVIPEATSPSGNFNFWVTRLRVLLEALSRLVLRLSPADAEVIFKRALTYCNTPILATHLWLKRATNNLLTRAWEALPPQNRAGFVFDVLSSPIAGLDGLENCERDCPEPGDLLPGDADIPVPERNSETEERWVEIVQLVLRGLRSTGEARRRAARRLISLSVWNRLTDQENEQLAQALWNVDFDDECAMPSGALSYDWVFLLLPEPEPCIAEKHFRKKWLSSPDLPANVVVGMYFTQVAHAIMGLNHHKQALVLNDDERSNLSSIVDVWINDPVVPDNHPTNLFGKPYGHRTEIAGLQHILPKINLPSESVEKLYAKVMELNETGTPAFQLYAGLAKLCPSRIENIIESMRVNLVSDTIEKAEKALIGLEYWIKCATDSNKEVPNPPMGLIQEIGISIASRRKGILMRSLLTACWIFQEGTHEYREAIAKWILHGLDLLHVELDYGREFEDDNLLNQVPELRWGCAHLAMAMSKGEYRDNPAVKKWLDILNNDPLPEVRYAEAPNIKTSA